jgi:hypothetical protein
MSKHFIVGPKFKVALKKGFSMEAVHLLEQSLLAEILEDGLSVAM